MKSREVMTKRIIEIEEKALKNLESKLYIPRKDLELQEEANWTYVPSIDSYVANEISLLGRSLDDSRGILRGINQKPANLYEFVEFLKHIKENNSSLYDKVTNPHRIAENLEGRRGMSEYDYQDKIEFLDTKIIQKKD